MSDLRTILERGVGGATPPPDGFDRMMRRRDRKRRNQRIAAGVVGIAVFVAAVWIVTNGLSLDRSEKSVVPAGTGTMHPGPTETGPVQSGPKGTRSTETRPTKTGSAETSGHTATYSTSLSLRAHPKRVCLLCGDRDVRFAGQLRSTHASCAAHSTVKLVETSTGVWSETQTDGEGKYAFVLTQPRGSWRVRFPGKIRSDTSHDHLCEASVSRVVHISVLG